MKTYGVWIALFIIVQAALTAVQFFTNKKPVKWPIRLALIAAKALIAVAFALLVMAGPVFLRPVQPLTVPHLKARPIPPRHLRILPREHLHGFQLRKRWILPPSEEGLPSRICSQDIWNSNAGTEGRAISASLLQQQCEQHRGLPG